MRRARQQRAQEEPMEIARQAEQLQALSAWLHFARVQQLTVAPWAAREMRPCCRNEGRWPKGNAGCKIKHAIGVSNHEKRFGAMC
jgi:hypothetical protein